MPSPATISAIPFGYGTGAGTAPRDAEAHLARLAGPDKILSRHAAVTMDDTLRLADEFRRARKRREALGGEAAYKAAREKVGAAFSAAATTALARIADTDDPLRERLLWLWADHFAVAPKNIVMRAVAPAYLDQAIRPNVTARFADLLKAVVTHPMMLSYLDQVQSIGPNSPAGKRRGAGLNENLAREVLELHTLGVGGPYTQDDVRQLAELFTGLSANHTDGFLFREAIAEPGPELVLGRTYGGGAPDVAHIFAVLEDLAIHPATAAHISRKLATHFVADDPDPALVTAIEAAWRTTGGDLMAVTEAMLTHPAAWGDTLEKARQPFDFLAATVIALGVRGEDLTRMPLRERQRAILRPLRAMGQPFMEPGGPDGWAEEADHWITPLGLAHRILWSGEAAKRAAPHAQEPSVFLKRALGDAASERLTWAVGVAETRADAVAIVLASPEFNRR
ncbi:MAG: DUF1800 domain-containing protein [Pseudomonadota bacterium]